MNTYKYERNNKNLDSVVRQAIQQALARHRKRYPNETHATRQELWDLYHESGGHCYYSDKPFGMGTWDRPSPDRIDSKKGYTKENVVWARWVVNRMKGTLTSAQFEEECRAVADVAAM